MDLKQFLELFNPNPGNRYIQITDKFDETTTALENILSKVDGELHLVCYGEPESQHDNFKTSIQYIKNMKTPFRALPREHNIVILKNILHLHDNPELLLRIAYTTLANNANIIIMQDKNTMQIEELKILLEKLEFRSANDIDILPEFDLVVAKKMHMWGNGL